MAADQSREGFEIVPEPTPEELEALRTVLKKPDDESRSEWWREGVREIVEPDF